MLIGAELAGTVRGPVELKRAAVLVDRQRAIVWQAISDAAPCCSQTDSWSSAAGKILY
jgi:hypothetical protein